MELKPMTVRTYPFSTLSDLNIDALWAKIAQLEAANIWQLKDEYDPITESVKLSVVSLGNKE